MKLGVVGSRLWLDKNKVFNELKTIKEPIKMIISGGAEGVDSIANEYAKLYGLIMVIFYPNWKSIGKSAGYARNIKIINASDKVIAFHNGTSKGTLHSIQLAMKQHKLLKIVTLKD